MCSMWVDGLHGVAHHLTRRAGLAIIAKAPIDKLRGWGRRRGWQGLRLVSGYDSPMITDLGIEGSRGGQFPAVSVFTRSAVDGAEQVRHAYTQSADYPDGSGRGIDLINPVWQTLDLLPRGRGDWVPDNTYPGSGRAPSVQLSSAALQQQRNDDPEIATLKQQASDALAGADMDTAERLMSAIRARQRK